MTFAQALVTYAVCWWMVLFMLLPSGAEPEQTPGSGHAPSAPANPRLKRKFKMASLWAVLPTLLIYMVASNAKAADEGMYTTHSGCKRLEKYKPSADLNVKDGEGAGGKKVKSANLAGGFDASKFDSVDIPLDIPVQNYVDRKAQATAAQNAANNNAGATKRTPTSINGRNVDLSESFIHAGKLTVTKDGDAQLDGTSIADSTLTTEDCHD